MSSSINDTLSALATTATTSIETTPAPTSPPVLNYVWNYTAHVLGPVVCWITATLLLSGLLLCYRRYPQLLVVDKLSPTVILLFANHLLNNAMFIFSDFIVNFIVEYGPQVATNHWNDTWWRFWTNNYSIAAPASVFFVTLDRFLVLKMAYRYGREIQAWMKWGAYGTMAALYVFSLVDVLIAWPYDDGEFIDIGMY
jgi:hypothetical protein